MQKNYPKTIEENSPVEGNKGCLQSAARRALKASILPAAIGAFLGMSAGIQAGSTAQAKFMLSIITAGLIGIIFGTVSFVLIYAFHRFRGK